MLSVEWYVAADDDDEKAVKVHVPAHWTWQV
jgi:hypothetical protein